MLRVCHYLPFDIPLLRLTSSVAIRSQMSNLIIVTGTSLMQPLAAVRVYSLRRVMVNMIFGTISYRRQSGDVERGDFHICSSAWAIRRSRSVSMAPCRCLPIGLPTLQRSD